MVIFVDIKSNVGGAGDDPELLELDHDLLHAAGLKQPLPLALFPLASSQPLGQSHCVPAQHHHHKSDHDHNDDGWRQVG